MSRSGLDRSVTICSTNNGTVQRAAAKDSAMSKTATTAAPLQPMVPRFSILVAKGNYTEPEFLRHLESLDVSVHIFDDLFGLSHSLLVRRQLRVNP